MGDRDKSGKEVPRSSSAPPLGERRRQPVDPVPDPLPPSGPNRRRRDPPRAPPPQDRDRMREIFVLPPNPDARLRASPHPSRRIIIDFPAAPGRIWREVRERVLTPFDDPNPRIKREPKAYNVPEGILPSVDVGGAVGIGGNLQKPPSNYGCTSLEIPMQDGNFLQSSGSEVESVGLGHSSRNLFRTLTRSVRGNVSSFLGRGESSREVPPPALPEATEGSQLATDESLSTHPSLESGSLYISNLDSSDNTDSETDGFKRPVNVPVNYSSEESVPNTDSDGSRAAGSVVDKTVVKSSEDIAREDRPDPDSDRSLSPEPVDQPMSDSLELGLVREDTLSDIDQAAYHDHVNPSGALSVESTDGTVQDDIYRIRVGSPVDIQIAYDYSGVVTTCLRSEPDGYFFDEGGAQSDSEESKYDDENYF